MGGIYQTQKKLTLGIPVSYRGVWVVIGLCVIILMVLMAGSLKRGYAALVRRIILRGK